MAERTKIWIANAMKDLMREKPIEKIRVTEICRKAMIERPTFYYHFKDKHDLSPGSSFRTPQRRISWMFREPRKHCAA